MAQDWLRKFERALSQPTVADMDSLFNSDCHWRDVLALNWEIITHSGSTAVPQALIHAARHHGPHDFKVNQQRMPAQWVKRIDVDTIEVFFDFQTNAIIEPATIGSYNPQTQTYVVVDTLDGQRFSSDLVIDGNTSLYRFSD